MGRQRALGGTRGGTVARRYGTYERLSLDREGAGLAVASQRGENREYGDGRGWRYVGSYDDNDTSAYDRSPRPGYDQLLADLEAGVIDAVVCWHVDRLTRKPIELEHVIDLADRLKIELGTVHGEIDLATPTGRLLARQLGAFARYEQEHKSERQRLANRRRAVAGEAWVSGLRCYGYDEAGLTVVEDEAKVLKDAAKRALAGESLRSIVADLRERGIPTSVGGEWSQHSLARVLQNPRLAGIRMYRGENVGKGAWKPILDANTHKKLVALLSDPSRRSPHATNVRKYLLSGGFLVCGYPMPENEAGICGKLLQTQPSNHGKRGYICRKGSPSYGCGRIRIAADSLEDETAARAMARLSSRAVRERLERAIGSAAEDDGEIMTSLAALDERAEEAGREFVRRNISMATLKAVEAEVRAERKVLRERLAQAERLKGMPSTTPQALAEWWVDAPLERRRDMLSLVLEKVIVKPASRQGFINLDLDRLEWVWK